MSVSGLLLDWYDRSARRLPWRVAPEALRRGVRPDPYRVWLSEIMLQQTTVAAVQPYFHRFTSAWPDVMALAAAPDAEVMAGWAGLGYYTRARNLLKCARVVAAGGGVFPDTEEGLAALPGVGPYTAAAIAAIAFDRAANVVDGNVERVMARFHAVTDPLPAARPALRRLAAGHVPGQRPGDHAQALMDLGATLCTPRNPACGLCPLRAGCMAAAEGIAGSLPRKAARPEKPQRHGHVWLAQRPDGAILVEERPPSGLLGGMLGLPTGPWEAEPPAPTPPFLADWQHVGAVRHTFTHFHLRLDVHAALVAEGAGFRSVAPENLPTLMRKALILGRDALGAGARP